MAMKNMAMTAEEAKEYSGCCPVDSADSADSGPKYPWGLCIDLNDGSMKKLGITDLPQVGSEMYITCKVMVESVSMDQRREGEAETRCTLQITDMEMTPAARDLASELYKTK